MYYVLSTSSTPATYLNRDSCANWDKGVKSMVSLVLSSMRAFLVALSESAVCRSSEIRPTTLGDLVAVMHVHRD